MLFSTHVISLVSMSDPDLVKLNFTPDGKSFRRTQPEVLLDILQAIPIDSVGNVEAISRQSNTRWDTCKKYLELIVLLQQNPEVTAYGVKGQRGKTMYRRESGKIKRELPT